MTLVTLSRPIAWPGICGSYDNGMFITNTASLTSAGHYVAYVMAAQQDMVVSHVGIRFSNNAGSPTSTITIETVDATTGLPTGTLWSTNTTVTTGTITANTYVLSALTASATITKGQVFCVKVALASGTNQSISCLSGQSTFARFNNLPYVVNNTGTPTVGVWQNFIATLSLGSSATTLYQLEACMPVTSAADNNFNNTSSAKRGLLFTPPMKCRAIGARWISLTGAGNFNLVLCDNSGAELSSSSTAYDGDYSAKSNNGAYIHGYFDNTVTLTAGTPYRLLLEPSSATNINLSTITLASANYRGGTAAGTAAQYTAFTGSYDDSQTTVIPVMDLLIDQIDDGTGSGGGGVVGVIGG